MASCTETTWTYPSTDGHSTIYATIWTPDDQPVRAVIQICHGMMEHIRRYDRFARTLCARGFLVCGDDHLGHGRTAVTLADRGYFGPKDGVAHMVEDLHTLRLEMQRRFPDKPYLLLGHSMGSFLTRDYITRHGQGLAGYICCGTSGRNPMAKAGIALASVAAAVAGGKKPSPLIDRMAFGRYNSRYDHAVTGWEWLSRDTQGYPDSSADDRCNFPFTNAGFRDLFRLLDHISGKKWSDQVPRELPIALFSGDMDPVGNYGKGVRQVYRWLQESGIQDLSLTLYPGARHELHNEINRDEFTNDVVGWIDRHIPASA